MFNAIVSQPDEYRNFGFESLTSDERAEYDAWADEAYKDVPYPEPEDLGLPSDYNIVPMDDDAVERDYHLLVDAGWIERPRLHRVINGVSQFIYARVNLKSQLLWRDFTSTPPRPVKTALDNGSDNYRWGNAFIYFKYESDAQAYRSHIKAQERQAQDARFEQTGVWY